jgi:hypothetical protein
MKLSNNTNSDSGMSYETVMNNQSYTIHSGITQPCQFSLGNIPTMIGITDVVGKVCMKEKFQKFSTKQTTL